MRARAPVAVVVALVACGDSTAELDATAEGSGSGAATTATAQESSDDDTTQTGGTGSGDTGDCQDDADCGEHAVCTEGMCTCAEGFVACDDTCVPVHAATFDVDLDEVIDAQPELGRHFDLALAPGEVPLVVYAIALDTLWYARRDAAWAVEEAWPPFYDRLDDAAVAASSTGAVEIAVASFYDGTSSYRHGSETPEGWAFASMLALENSAIGGIDVAFGPDDTAHWLLEFRSSISSQLSVYLTPGDLLSIVPMDAESGASDLVIDAMGRPQIAYDIMSDGWYHARHDGSRWVHTQLDVHPTNNYFVGVDIAVTTDGRARLLAYDERMDELLLAREDEGGWTTEVVVTDPDLRLARIAIDDSDVEHVVYFAMPDRVMYGRNDGAAWTFVQVGTGTDGRAPLIATDDPGAAHIVYGFDDFADANDPELRYVRMAITPACG